MATLSSLQDVKGDGLEGDFVGHRGRREFSGCALSIIALLPKTTPAGVRGLLPPLAPAGPEVCGAVGGWGSGPKAEDQSPLMTGPWR